MKYKRKMKNISVLLLAIFIASFFSNTANAITKSVKNSIGNELINSVEGDDKKDNVNYSVENSDTKNSEWKTFYEQTSKLIRESWNENYFDTIELNLNDNDVVIDNNKTNYNLDNLKSYVQNHKDDMKSFNSYTEKEDDLILPISDILNIIGAETVRKDEKIIINDFGNNVELSVDSSDMKVNGLQYELDSEVIEDNGEIMASKDILTEGLGVKVNYDEVDNVISLERPFQTMRLIVKLKDKKINLDKYKAVKTIISPDNIAILQFNSIMDTELCYEELKNNIYVEYVEPDMYVVNEDGIVEQPQNPVNVLSEGEYSYKSWGVKHIESDKYVKYLNNKDERNSVTVAVIDTGVDIDHPFLRNRLLEGRDFVYDDSVDDENGHGTHVAGTIVDNTQGLDVKILPVRVFDYTGTGTTLNIANGIEYAANNGANIINLSIYITKSSEHIDKVIADVINKNVTVVAAAGNWGKDTQTQCPAHLENAIVVSAIDSSNNRAIFSNYGETVDVAAPGVDVFSSYLNGGYKYLTGTSMAAPHITAVAAMYKLDNPSLTPAEIEKKIKDNTYDIGEDGFDKYFGHGVPKLSKAIPNIPLESLILNETEIKLSKMQEFHLKVSYNPTNTTELKKVTWTTSNENVATVDNNGKVKSVGLGQAVITAKVREKTASCTVIVEQSEIINIPDKNLRKFINNQLGNEEDSEISLSEIITITEVDEDNTKIENLEGLQYASNLERISFNGGNVSDISCFENVEMKKMKFMSFNNTKIRDISMFRTASFPELYYLNLLGNCISDLSPLSDVPFKNVFISNQKITLNSVEIEEGDSVQIDNPIRDTNGNVIDKINFTDGIYDKENHTITWDNIKESKTVSFSFKDYVEINGIKQEFDGVVSIPVKVDEVVVDIPDKNLKRVINQSLYKVVDADITKAELKNIYYLYANNEGISNLEGLQYAKNLSKLYLDGNNISDIGILSNISLPNLEYLSLYNNKISNINSFSNADLPKLIDLNLSKNKISNIDDLSSANLPNLSYLSVNENMICDISSFEFEKFPNLECVYLYDQQITLKDKYVKFDEGISIVNSIKYLSGEAITNISVINGKYDLQDNKVIWNNIKENNELTYKYYGNESVGQVSISYSGMVYLPVIIDDNREDVNNDNVIDKKDLDLVAKYHNITIDDENWQPKFDLNNDEIIDIYDYVIISKKM